MPDSAATTDELVFLPLGGCGEIGMNLNAYGYGPAHSRRWIIVDVGVTFGNAATPGIDLICADPAYLVGEHIDAVFLTHAHEDHIGAIGLLYPLLRTRAPIYATPFTAELVRGKMQERGVDTKRLRTISLEASVTAGPFTVRYMTLTHSIPEPNALAIETPAGMILHTGDWKIDPEPLVGARTDIEGLTALGDRGVLAMVCDSTNVFEAGEAGSEDTVRKGLIDLIAQQTGAVAVTTFASNVARVKSIIEAANAAGRDVCLVGRSMHKITGAAKAVVKAVPELIGKLTGNAVRVPVPNVSMAILMLNLQTPTTKDEINEFLRVLALHSPLQNQISYTEDPDAVSSDFVGSREAAIVDSKATIVEGNRCVLYLWYDNEFGYCNQVVRIVYKMACVNYRVYPVAV